MAAATTPEAKEATVSCFICSAPAVPVHDCPRAYCAECTAKTEADIRRGYAILSGQSEPLVVFA